jgi:hypothetical protein
VFITQAKTNTGIIMTQENTKKQEIYLQPTMHGFDVDIATVYGLEEAIIINNFQFWINKNYSDGVNRKEDRTWTYNTTSSLVKLFPYMSLNAIRYSIDQLVKKGVLIKGCHNKNGYDRTTWYAFSDEKKWLYSVRSDLSKNTNGFVKNNKWICENSQMDLRKTTNGFVKIHTPIPDNKQQIVNEDSKQQIVNEDSKDHIANPSPVMVDGLDANNIVNLYHTILPTLPKVLKINEARKKKIKALCKEDLPTLESWGSFFETVSQSKFLMGKTQSWAGCDFEWLINPANALKVAEGRYRNKCSSVDDMSWMEGLV